MDGTLHRLCDRCLGRRLVGAAGVDAQREAGVRQRTVGGWDEVAEADCPVCEGTFSDTAEWLRVAKDALAPYEFTTFQAGTMFPQECEDAEKAAAEALGMPLGESVRTEANRLLAPLIAEATDGAVDPEGRPDVVVQVDTRFWHTTARANSLFVAGRYTKHRRDIPQTHWPCKRCQGRGCWECDDAGVRYEESVEDAIGQVLKPAFDAEGYSFHGAGREDIDALMLGTGRPFVLELHDPKRRSVDLTSAEDAINAATETSGVGVSGLRITEKEEVARIKSGEYQKEYLAHCLTETPVTPEQVQTAAEGLRGVTLDQRTPERVSHRRADLVRKRTVHHITVESPPDAEGTRFSLRVLAESGTYIKEMVSGDDGRTVPSFSERLGAPVTVEFLDVVAILDEAHP